MWQQVRVYVTWVQIQLARMLSYGTGTVLVPEADVVKVGTLVDELHKYAEHSGALQSPHRIRARRRVMHLTEQLDTHVGRLEVGA